MIFEHRTTVIPESDENVVGDRILALLEQLTLEEKAALVSGASMWRTVGNERIGLGPMVLSDGPIGIRGEDVQHGVGVTVPCGSALAATWDLDLIRGVGAILGREARLKGVHVVLAPVVNMHRSLLAGRNFESYSEDPYLASCAAVDFIKGIQSQGVAATVKHFIGNESETLRVFVNSVISERALREIYLPPFEASVIEADVACVMAAYNRVNGVYSSENALLIKGILKEEWKFGGVVMSDWYSLRSTVPAMTAGLDLEMPGPTLYRGQQLVNAIRRGELAEAELDEKVERILRLAERVGALRTPDSELPPVQFVAPEPLLRRTAASSFVLLRNQEKLLPFDSERLRRLALIGPFASVVPYGGGSAALQPMAAVTAEQGIRLGLSEQIRSGRLELINKPGCFAHRFLPASAPPGAEAVVDFFANRTFEGPPALTEKHDRSRLVWNGSFPHNVPVAESAVQVGYDFIPEVSGTYTFGVCAIGEGRLYINDELMLKSYTPPPEFLVTADIPEQRVSVALEAGVTVKVLAQYLPEDVGLSVFALGYLPPSDEEEMIAEAVAAAKLADTAVVVVGLGEDWESEGYDRFSLALPGRQDELVEKVLAVNSNTVVVVCAGAPVLLPWSENARAVLFAWYAGQEFGDALADVLFGIQEPGGRLPTTFPRSPNELLLSPVPKDDYVLDYEESTFIGYRGYDRSEVEPLYCFGYGLGYTEFSYENISLDGPLADGVVDVEIALRNVGDRAGSEVVQLYVSSPKHTNPAVVRSVRKLRAFGKVTVGPGERATVRLQLSRRAFSYWDTDQHGWRVIPGEYTIQVGSSSRDLCLLARVRYS